MFMMRLAMNLQAIRTDMLSTKNMVSALVSANMELDLVTPVPSKIKPDSASTLPSIPFTATVKALAAAHSVHNQLCKMGTCSTNAFAAMARATIMTHVDIHVSSVLASALSVVQSTLLENKKARCNHPANNQQVHKAT